MTTLTFIYLISLVVILPGGYFIKTYLYPSSKAAHRQFKGDAAHNTIELKNKFAPAADSAMANSRRNSPLLKKKHLSNLDEKLYRAGYPNPSAKVKFYLFQFCGAVICAAATFYIARSYSPFLMYTCVTLGAFIGLVAPTSYLNRRIAQRDEEILYYLPLVIEQLVVGVGSGLDIGPCIQRVVSMANERDTHNAVTVLFRDAMFLSRSGISLDDGLEELGNLVGHPELKHSFMTLGQVSRHGGEITRQLQELANAVTRQRETTIESRIKRLELTATGPVALVFVSFLIVLLTGIGLQMMKVFNT